MALVVDASVAVKCLLVEEDSTTARNLFQVDNDLHAPRLLVSEVGNAIWRRARLGHIDRVDAIQLAATISTLPIRWHSDETICADAARLALTYDRPVYDFMYVALAQRLGTRVVTADQRLLNALSTTTLESLLLALTDAPSAR